MIRQRLCEALFAADCAQQASESLLKMTHLFGEEGYPSESITNWVLGGSALLICCCVIQFISTDFTQRCLATPECNSDMDFIEAQHNETMITTPLLREWAKAILVNNSWKYALNNAVGVSAFLTDVLGESDTPLVLS